MATWPSSLPIAEAPDYALQATDPTVRTDMESGPARVRRRFTAAPDRLTLRFLFSESEMATFRTFWDVDARSGAAWWWLQIRDGRGALVSKEVRPATGSFRAQLSGSLYWAVTFEVEVRNA